MSSTFFGAECIFSGLRQHLALSNCPSGVWVRFMIFGWRGIALLRTNRIWCFEGCNCDLGGSARSRPGTVAEDLGTVDPRIRARAAKGINKANSQYPELCHLEAVALVAIYDGLVACFPPLDSNTRLARTARSRRETSERQDDAGREWISMFRTSSAGGSRRLRTAATAGRSTRAGRGSSFRRTTALGTMAVADVAGASKPTDPALAEAVHGGGG